MWWRWKHEWIKIRKFQIKLKELFALRLQPKLKKILNSVVTCHDYWRKDLTGGHKIYSAMMEMFPDFYVHTGDVEYYDKPEPYALTEEIMRFKWDRLFALPLQRKFWTQTTSYFMKDDHDVLRDDAWPGMKYGTVTWDRGLEIFNEEQFPSYDKFYKTIRWERICRFGLPKEEITEVKIRCPTDREKQFLVPNK